MDNVIFLTLQWYNPRLVSHESTRAHRHYTTTNTPAFLLGVFWFFFWYNINKGRGRRSPKFVLERVNRVKSNRCVPKTKEIDGAVMIDNYVISSLACRSWSSQSPDCLSAFHWSLFSSLVPSNHSFSLFSARHISTFIPYYSLITSHTYSTFWLPSTTLLFSTVSLLISPLTSSPPPFRISHLMLLHPFARWFLDFNIIPESRAADFLPSSELLLSML